MILVGVQSAWIRLSLYTLLRNIRRFFRLLSRFFGKRMADAGSWLPRRSLCWKYWSFRIVQETTCSLHVMKRSSHAAVESQWQTYHATIYARRHSSGLQQELRHPIPFSLLRLLRPSAGLFSRMIVLFPLCPACASCN